VVQRPSSKLGITHIMLPTPFRTLPELFRKDFKLSILCTLAGFVFCTVTPFVVFRLLAGQITIFLIDLSLVIISVGIAAYALITRRVEHAAIMSVFCITSALVATAFYNPESAPYWLYCNIFFAFTLAPPRTASLFVSMGFVSILVQPKAFTGIAQYASFVVTFPAAFIFAYIFSSRNESQRKKLAELALTDVLTNIGNRRAFNQELEAANASAHSKQPPSAIALLDIDHFKTINDKYGHEQGDNVLKAFAEVVENNIRQDDRLFRIGGEEFCLIFDHIDERNAIASMERICLAVSQFNFIQGHRVTVSIGITQLSTQDSQEDSLKRADRALYSAKHTGRNRVVYS